MPFVPSDESLSLLNKAAYEPVLDTQEEPTVTETLGAYWRQENIIGSALNKEIGLPETKDNPDFDAYSFFTEEEKSDRAFVSKALYADNEEEILATRRQVAKERADKDIMAQAGATGVALGLPVMIFDPISFLTIGGAVANTYKAGRSIFSSAMVTGSVIGAETAVQEAALHTQQLTRTFGESAINVSASTFLSGVLGVSIAKMSGAGADGKFVEALVDVMDVEPKIAAGVNSVIDDADVPAFGTDSVGAAKTFKDTKVKGKIARKLVSWLPFDPLSRTITSENPFTRIIASRLAENPIEMDGDILQAAESLAMSHRGKLGIAIERNEEFFVEYKKSGGKLPRKKFNEAVASAIRIGDSDVPQIKSSADMWNAELYTPLKDEMVALKLLPEDVEIHTANNYLNRVWNKEKINAKYPQFVRKVSTWLADKDQRLFNEASAASRQIDELNKAEVSEIKITEGARVKAGDRGNVGTVITVQDDIAVVMFVNKEKGTKASKRFSLDKISPIDPIAKTGKVGKEIARLQKIIDKAEFKKGKDFEPEDYNNIAKQIATRITNTPDGRLPYDWKLGDGAPGGGVNNKGIQGTALRGPLRNRVFQIDDAIIEEFLENDIETLGSRFLQNVAADVELTREFGDVNMTAEIRDISRWYEDKMEVAPTSKESLRLGKQRDADIRDISGMRDRMRGVYGFSEDNIWTRMARSSRDLNYLRLLGGVTVSSLPDVSRVFMAEGFVKTFKSGLAPLVANSKRFKSAAAELKRYGVGNDAIMSGKSEVIADVGDYAQGGTMLERGLRAGASKFGKINLLDYWTAGMKQLHAVTMQTSIFDGLSKGKYDKRLARLGIDEQSAKDMYAQVKLYGSNQDGIWLTNAKNWDRPDLERMWGAAVRKESDRVIIIPGQEKPLFMSREMGKTVGQFRSFILSATQRVLIAGLQRQDHNTIGGFTSLVGMGMFTYYLKAKIAGRELSEDPSVWVLEGIERSGVMGMMMEFDTTVAKISGNNGGMRSLLGISEEASRQVSRSVAESLLGPTIGSGLTTVIKAANAISSEGDMTDADIRAMRRLIPYQNHVGLRKAFDYVEEAIGDL
tara:strand:- start:38 stop:3280 length:3243 start_codon:yes stop_codon:yes gene_type:complete